MELTTPALFRLVCSLFPQSFHSALLTRLFPGISTASTFDRTLMRSRGAAMGAEFRGKGIHVALGPGRSLNHSQLLNSQAKTAARANGGRQLTARMRYTIVSVADLCIHS